MITDDAQHQAQQLHRWTGVITFNPHDQWTSVKYYNDYHEQWTNVIIVILIIKMTKTMVSGQVFNQWWWWLGDKLSLAMVTSPTRYCGGTLNCNYNSVSKSMVVTWVVFPTEIVNEYRWLLTISQLIFVSNLLSFEVISAFWDGRQLQSKRKLRNK